ncbi:hypothetical protein BPAE_0101g00160 [Botrytis paeoniae]|uniref:Uncharacterized protein n=1 Tax=Botrytis paeoniae TaxID=278948 RepID=A0A4Z1FM42_9HELO|nr:hypothetical protein BPAE_0101g00160 [Botrytis paeoniae]
MSCDHPGASQRARDDASYRVPPALQVEEAFAAADEDKLTEEQRGILKDFVARKHKKSDKIIKAQDLALKDVEPGCRALAAVLKDVLTKREAAKVEKTARDIKGYEVVVTVMKPALRSQKLVRNEFMVTRSIANAQKMLLERHEANSFRSYASPREHATQREASGILEFSPREDWKAAHYIKGPERSVEAIKNVKRYARVDPEYAEQDETRRWRKEHLFDANIKNERQWKALNSYQHDAL